MVASHDPANVAKLCGAPLPIFVSVINLGTLTRANTAIARDRRYEREIFEFLGASVNRNYCLNANKEIFQEKLRIGVGLEVKIIYGSESADELLLYKTRREAFTAGIQGCAWLSNEPYQSLRPIGPCEQLILSTRDWYLGRVQQARCLRNWARPELCVFSTGQVESAIRDCFGNCVNDYGHTSRTICKRNTSKRGKHALWTQRSSRRVWPDYSRSSEADLL